MKIQTVTVEIHEKRNNPNAYGHYDSRVVYTAEVDAGEVAEQVVERLQFIARQQVATECDRWEAEVKREEQRINARTSLDWIIERSSSSEFTDQHQQDFEKHLEKLEAHEHAEFRVRLETAKVEYLDGIRNRLNDLVGRAKTRGLGSYDTDRFEALLRDLPEDECQGFRDRLEAALAPKVEVPLAENEEDIAF